MNQPPVPASPGEMPTGVLEAQSPPPEVPVEVPYLAAIGDPTLDHTPQGVPPEGRARVEWVRLSDLSMRAGGSVLSTGQEANQRLHEVLRESLQGQHQRLRERFAAREREVTTSPAAEKTRESVSREAATLRL